MFSKSLHHLTQHFSFISLFPVISRLLWNYSMNYYTIAKIKFIRKETNSNFSLTFFSLYCDMRNHQRRWRLLRRDSGAQFFAEALYTVTIFPRHERDVASLLFTTEPNTKLHRDELSQFLESSRVDSASERYVLLNRALRAGLNGSRNVLSAIRRC